MSEKPTTTAVKVEELLRLLKIEEAAKKFLARYEVDDTAGIRLAYRQLHSALNE